MTRMGVVLVTVFLILAGCAGTVTDRDLKSRAEYHMWLADSLQAISSLRDATLVYKVIAELYPNTPLHSRAVLNTALLYSDPVNPAMDDSSSLYWLETYLTLPVSREEKRKASIYATMVKRILLLRKANNARIVENDSLQVLLRRQSAELAMRSRRISELEDELIQRNDEVFRLREIAVRANRIRVEPSRPETEKLRDEELEKLREVDVRINERRGRK